MSNKNHCMNCSDTNSLLYFYCWWHKNLVNLALKDLTVTIPLKGRLCVSGIFLIMDSLVFPSSLFIYWYFGWYQDPDFFLDISVGGIVYPYSNPYKSNHADYPMANFQHKSSYF